MKREVLIVEERRAQRRDAEEAPPLADSPRWEEWYTTTISPELVKHPSVQRGIHNEDARVWIERRIARYTPAEVDGGRGTGGDR